jgi:1-deoxy-D-xylulose-5-phosphate reductoisomerase
MKEIVVLGCTGSVGRQTLELVRQNARQLRVVGLSARGNVELLARQVQEFQPAHFVVADASAGEKLLASHPEHSSRCLGFGTDALCELARQPCDVVVNALLGYAGLRPTLAALAAGTDVALSNKECMVVAGELVRHAADAHGASIRPVDSEHSAIDQCIRAGHRSEVRRVVLTASGGPFRTWPLEKLRDITRADALNHPTWSMGDKITVDSATLMNKGLEVIEAHWLFDIDFDRIDILVHPESIVHSMVEFVDGSVIAQLGPADMRLPIWYALHAPERTPLELPRLDLAQIGALHFEQLDRKRFPCVDLALQAGLRGGVAPAVLNAANEVAVAAFLEDRLRYLDIPELLGTVLEEATAGATASSGLDLQALHAADSRARESAQRFILETCPTGEPPC